MDVVGFPGWVSLPGSIAERDDTLVHERADDGACDRDRDRDVEYQEIQISRRRRQTMGFQTAVVSTVTRRWGYSQRVEILGPSSILGKGREGGKGKNSDDDDDDDDDENKPPATE